MEAQLSTSGDFFSFLAFLRQSFPNAAAGLGASTPALGVRWRGGEVGVRMEEGVRDPLYLVSLRPRLPGSGLQRPGALLLPPPQ